jgi:acyl-CoA reductase-like NAD-dependent aldehyde dehydrogenase
MKPHLINGEWIAGASSKPNINPSDTRDVIDEYAQADMAQVEQAIAAARQAFPSWAMRSIQERADARLRQ